jgi:thiamine-monophosphate kinase
VRENVTVSEIGERGLLEVLAPFVCKPGGEVVEGFGDDAAVVAYANSAKLVEVLTTDMMVEGTHFIANGSTDWERLGRKAVTANISDMAAMGAMPKFLLISIGVPGTLTVGSLRSLFSGMANEARRHQALLVGGDTVRSAALVLNIALTGVKPSNEPLPLRSRCRPGQTLYVSGELGGSRAGLELLTDHSLDDMRRFPFTEDLLLRHNAPQPRLELGRALASQFGDLAMIDISDSLFNELHLLARASGAGLEVRVDQVPVMPEAARFAHARGRDPWVYALSSGEEYELLFATAAPVEKVRKMLWEAKVEVPVTPVGRVGSGHGVRLAGRDGAPVDFSDQTFQHFA